MSKRRINYETRKRKIKMLLQKWRMEYHGEEQGKITIDCFLFFSEKLLRYIKKNIVYIF